MSDILMTVSYMGAKVKKPLISKLFLAKMFSVVLLTGFRPLTHKTGECFSSVK
jgi:hypothetical protein